MKTLRSAFMYGVAIAVLAIPLPLFSSGQTFAQDDDSRQRERGSNERASDGTEGDLIGRLNLTPEQVRRIREIRQQNAEEMRNSRQRMIRAQRALDESIYADSVDEATIEGHARDLAAAQVAVLRLRALTELRIRRLLSPDQLNLLRVIRQEARDRGRANPRGRRQNSSAFQERQNQKAVRPNPSGAIQPQPTVVRPETTEKTPSTSTPSSGKP